MNMIVLKIAARNFLDEQIRRIGGCPRCIRAAFVSAIVSLLSLVLSFLLGELIESRALVSVATGFLVATSSLWLLHVIVYGIRFANGRRVASVPERSRRQFLANFSRGALGVAAYTSIGLIAGSANAGSMRCGNYTCDSSNICCRDAGHAWCCSNMTTCNYSSRTCRMRQ